MYCTTYRYSSGTGGDDVGGVRKGMGSNGSRVVRIRGSGPEGVKVQAGLL